MISAAFNIGFLLISVIIVLVPTLLGIKRGTVKASVKLAVSILAAIISFIVCKASMPKMKTMFFGIARLLFDSDERVMTVLETIEDGTVLMTVVVGLLATLIMPFFFVLLYVIIKAVLGLVTSIVLAIVRKSGADLDGIINLGWAIGLVNGLLSLVILTMPVIGILNVVAPFTTSNDEYTGDFAYSYAGNLGSENLAVVIKPSEDGSWVGTLDGNQVQIISPDGSENGLIYGDQALTYVESTSSSVSALCDSVPVKVVGTIGAEPLFRSLTTFKVENTKISLLDEAQSFASCYKHLDPLLDTELKKYSKKQGQAIRLLSYDVQNSELTMLLVSEILPEMSQNWLDGEKYLGMKPPAVGKDLEPLVDKILEITSNTNRETVKEDVASVFEIFAIIFDHETLKYTSNTNELLDNISTKGYISSLLAATYANKRMSPLVVEITNLGIRAVGTTLNIPKDNEAVYDNLMKNICALVNKTSSVTVRDDRQKEIYDSLEVSFSDAGVKTTEDERAVIAYYLIDQFGARDDVSHGEIEEFFEAINEGFDRVENTSHSGKVKFVFTSSDFDSLSDKIYDFYSGNSNLIIKIKTDEGYSCIESTGDTVLVTKHSVDEEGNHVVDTYESDVAEKKNTFSNLSSSKDFECEGKTIEKMLLKSTEGIDDLDEKEALAEFENLEEGITKIVEFMDKVESGGSKMDTSSVEMLGDALQGLSSNKLLGSTGCDFIEGTLKSEFVQEKVDGLDSEVVDDVMVNLRNEDGNADPDFNLGNTLASGVQAAELVTQLGKDNGETDEPNEEVEKSLSWLIENMSPSSAKTICKMITPEFIRKKGLTNGDLNHVADMLKELFMQMAESDAMSEQEYKNESKAIQNLYNMMVKATSNGSKSMFDEDSGTTADSVITNYMNSKVVSNTVYTHAFKNGELKIDFLCFGSKSMKADDKEKLAKAVEEYYLKNKNSADPLFKDKLKALAAMLCIEIDFDEKGATYSFPETPGMNPLEYKDGKYTYTVNGKLVKGWTEINGKLYYFDSNGYAAIGWTTIKSETYYFTAETGARTGIVSIDDVLYAFDANGVLTEIIG